MTHERAATSNIANLTPGHANDLEARQGIKIVSNSEIPLEFPHISQMNLFWCGYLKRKFSKEIANFRASLESLEKRVDES